MANNKVVLNGETLIDLTEDSVTPETLLRGATAHDRSGSAVSGELAPLIDANYENREFTVTAVGVTGATGEADKVVFTSDDEPVANSENPITSGAIDRMMYSSGAVDKVPYFFRKTGGSVSAISDRSTDKIVGASVGWNQLIENGDFSSSTLSPWEAMDGSKETVSIANNTMTVATKPNLPATANVWLYGVVQGNRTTSGHKYYCYVNMETDTASTFKIELGGATKHNVSLSANTKTDIRFIADAASYNKQFLIYPYSAVLNVAAPTITYKLHKVMLIDLTQLFGTTIADYLATLESTTPGAGVSLFRSLGFNKDYYAYNPGSIESVTGVSGHVMRGFNQWDEEWELGYYSVGSGAFQTRSNGICSKHDKPIRVMPNTTYYMKVPYSTTLISAMLFYDANDNYISYVQVYSSASAGDTFVAPPNAYYARFYLNDNYGTTYKNDICINISDANRNGTYEPYAGHSYPLDSSLTLRGIFKLDANNRIYADGDGYGSDGSVERKYASLTLNGTEDWTAYTSSGVQWFYANVLTGVKAGSWTSPINAIMEKYVYVTTISSTADLPSITGDKVAAIQSTSYSRIWIKDTSIATADAFKTALSSNPLEIIYEKQTPTTESATPFTNPQYVNANGTEEYVSTGIVPVGHETEYPVNLLQKLIDLPTVAELYALILEN